MKRTTALLLGLLSLAPPALADDQPKIIGAVARLFAMLIGSYDIRQRTLPINVVDDNEATIPGLKALRSAPCKEVKPDTLQFCFDGYWSSLSVERAPGHPCLFGLHANMPEQGFLAAHRFQQAAGILSLRRGGPRSQCDEVDRMGNPARCIFSRRQAEVRKPARRGSATDHPIDAVYGHRMPARRTIALLNY
jgi:hypothetical protein